MDVAFLCVPADSSVQYVQYLFFVVGFFFDVALGLRSLNLKGHSVNKRIITLVLQVLP